MKKIDKNAYQEPRHDKGHLTILALVVAVVSIVALIGGIALFVNGVQASGAWSIVWRIILAVVLILFGGIFGWVSIMMLITAHSMINVRDGNVSDVGNSGMGTVNINKCPKCGAKLEDNADHCTKCGTKLEQVVKCECGTINSPDNEFCKKCGKKLK